MGLGESTSSVKLVRFKVVLIGDGGVGKTSIARRYLGEGFTQEYIKTIGANFYVKRTIFADAHFGKILIEWNIWDLAGQPTWDQVRPLYYKGAKAALVVFDVTSPRSYYNVPKWISELWKNVGGVLPFVLIGNKIDLRDKHPNALPPEAGKKYAELASQKVGIRIPYLETSAKTGENINEAFNHLARVILEYAIAKIRARKMVKR